MKKIVIEISLVCFVLFTLLVNFSKSETKKDSNSSILSANILAEANAEGSVICAFYPEGHICCMTNPGTCTTGWGNYEFYSYYP